MERECDRKTERKEGRMERKEEIQRNFGRRQFSKSPQRVPELSPLESSK